MIYKNGMHPASGCCAYGSEKGLRRLRATEVPKLTLRDNRRVYDLVLESGLLSKERIDEILQSGILTSPPYAAPSSLEPQLYVSV